MRFKNLPWGLLEILTLLILLILLILSIRGNLIDRIHKTERSLIDRIRKTEQATNTHLHKTERSLIDRIRKTEQATNTHSHQIPQPLAMLPENPEPVAQIYHGSIVRAVTFSDGKYLASAGDDNTIKLWNRNNPNELWALWAIFSDHTAKVHSIAFSSDGTTLASGSGDGTIILWDVRSKMKINTLEHSLNNQGQYSAVSAVAFSPNGQRLASAGNNVKFWNISNLKDITEGSIFQHNEYVWTIDFSPDGKWLAAGDNGGNVTVWDTQNSKVVKALKGYLKWPNFVGFSPNLDNPILATIGKYQYIKLWTLSDWELQGPLMNPAPVSSLAFSQDGKTLASVSSESVELWSVESGSHITSLKRQTSKVQSVAFASDGTTLASGGDDGMIRIWKVTPYLTPQQLEGQAKVKMIYFIPRGRLPQPHIWAKIDRLIRNVQQFYADEMERHGFVGKTFKFEKDENGRAVVYRFDGQFTDDYYLKSPHFKVIEEISEHFSQLKKDVYLIVADISSRKIGEAGGTGDLFPLNQRAAGQVNRYYERTAGQVLIPAPHPDPNSDFDLFTVAHELGHAFGLHHDFREHDLPEGSYIMSYDNILPYRLSKCAAEWLDKSRLFNDNRKFFNNPTIIERHSSSTDPVITQLLRFKVEDADGIHQIQLYVPTTSGDLYATAERHLGNPAEKQKMLERLESTNVLAVVKLHSCYPLNGEKTEIVEFELTDHLIEKVTLRIIDVLGNITEREFSISEDSAEPTKNP